MRGGKRMRRCWRREFQGPRVLVFQNIPEYGEIFSDNPQKIAFIGRILQTKFKKLNNNLQTPCAHTSSAALDSIVPLLSDDLD